MSGTGTGLPSPLGGGQSLAGQRPIGPALPPPNVGTQPMGAAPPPQIMGRYANNPNPGPPIGTNGIPAVGGGGIGPNTHNPPYMPPNPGPPIGTNGIPSISPGLGPNTTTQPPPASGYGLGPGQGGIGPFGQHPMMPQPLGAAGMNSAGIGPQPMVGFGGR